MDKLLLNKINDLYTLCDKYAAPVFSDFLDGGQQAFLEDHFTEQYGFHTVLFGGYSEAERKIYGVFPEWQEPENESFPCKCLCIAHRYDQSLSHRDYLGSVLGLGIDRGKTGDIIVQEKTAYFFVIEDIAEYICLNLRKVGNIGVTVQEVPFSDFANTQRRYALIETVVASSRLDAVLTGALNISRSVAARLIDNGNVRINHRDAGNASRLVKEGDLLSIRGYGRYLLDTIGGQTRKGRIHIVIKKYI